MQARHLLSLLALILLTGHTPALADESQTAAASVDESQFDPFEGYNRAMFEINHTLDTVFFRPISEVYGVIPSPARKGVRNVLTNLKSPAIFFNDLLQGDFNDAGDTFGRIVLNTTLGIGGLFDVATELGVPYHSADFGETLAKVEFPSGPYIVLPFLGPSTPRDMIGRGGDFLLNPVNWVVMNNDDDGLYFIAVGLDLLDRRTEARGFTDTMEKATDPYAFLRSLYKQSRVDNINGLADDNDSPSPMKSE